MMTQLSNGGYKVTPTIFKSDKPKIIEERIISDPDDLKIIMDALFSSTNEFGGTSYRSRIKGKNLFAGKTGTSQVRKITAEQRLRNLKNKDLPWKFRDHSLYLLVMVRLKIQNLILLLLLTMVDQARRKVHQLLRK